MPSRPRQIVHASTPMPTAPRRRGGLRSQTAAPTAANGTATETTGKTKLASQTQNKDVSGCLPHDCNEATVVAPTFRADVEGSLEQIRRNLDARKAEIAKRTVHVKRQLVMELSSALQALPEDARKMKVKDFDVQHSCDVVDMMTTMALEIFSSLDKVGDGAGADPLLETIRKPVRMNPRLTATKVPKGGAAGCASTTFETPAGEMPSKNDFWSTAAKKKTGLGNKAAGTGGDSPDEKILTISTKSGAILETCGVDLYDLAHDSDMVGSLDAASIMTIKRLQQLSSMILMHRENHGSQGIDPMEAVQEEDMEED